MKESDGAVANTSADAAPMNASDAHFPLEYRILATTVHAGLAVLGIAGNMMVIAVILRIRGMKTSTNTYLVSLALSDCLLFLAAMPAELANYFLPRNVYIYGAPACVILTFLPYLAINASSLSITAFTIERYIAICHPMRAKYICTVQRAQVIVGIIWLFSVLYNAPWLFLITVKPLDYVDLPNAETCTFSRDRHEYKVIYSTDLISFYVIPLILYFVLYGRIATILMRSSFRSFPKNNALTPETSSRSPGNNRTSCRMSNAHNLTKSRVQVVKMLIVIVVVFALCWLPYRALVFHNSFVDTPWINLWYLFFAKTMIFINSAINPILYNIMSAKFRRAFKELLTTCGKFT